jgi:hypothetical protein
MCKLRQYLNARGMKHLVIWYDIKRNNIYIIIYIIIFLT